MLDLKEVYTLLIIDDNQGQIDTYTDAIMIFNRNSEKLEIKSIIKRTMDEGLEALNTTSPDGAIVDLKLSGEEIDDAASGNIILEVITNSLRFPVVVYSGFPGALDKRFNMQNCLFKVCKRGEVKFSDLLKDLIKVHNTGITRILGKKGLIDHGLQKIFWDHFSPFMAYLLEDNTPNLEKILLRQTMSYLHEYFELDENGDFETYHCYEVYITPPIKGRPFTGDILKSKVDGKLYIILTPACDMLKKSTEKIALSEIEDINMKAVVVAKSKLKSENPTIVKQGKDTLNGLIRNSNAQRFHFLPPAFQFPGGFINFQKINSVDQENILKEYDRIACVSGIFAKDIISHFSLFYARQGQPDLDYDKLYSELFERE